MDRLDEIGTLVSSPRAALAISTPAFRSSGAGADRAYTETVIYCVIPRELADELYDKMVEYYEDNPNVTVIIDRREGPDRRRGKSFGGKREIRDRRRAHPGRFPSTDVT